MLFLYLRCLLENKEPASRTQELEIMQDTKDMDMKTSSKAQSQTEPT